MPKTWKTWKIFDNKKGNVGETMALENHFYTFTSLIHSVASSDNSAKTFFLKMYYERSYFQRAALLLWSKVLKALCGRCRVWKPN